LRRICSLPGSELLSVSWNLSFEEAAAVPLVFQTAWHMLIARAELQPGKKCLYWAPVAAWVQRDSDCEIFWLPRDRDGGFR